MPVYLLATGFTVWMAVEAVRRGQAQSWLWIILLFGPIGAAVYFFTEYVRLASWGAAGPRKSTAQDVRLAELEAKRLDTPVAWSSCAAHLRSRNDFPSAVEAASKAVERGPDLLDGHYELGLALLGANRSGDAVAHLARVVEGDRRYDSSNALRALAKAQEGSGDLAAARQTLDELAERSSRPEIIYDLARLQPAL